MPTINTSLPAAGGPRYAAVRDKGRRGAFVTASWAAQHLAVPALFGFSDRHQVEARQTLATAPDPSVS